MSELIKKMSVMRFFRKKNAVITEQIIAAEEELGLFFSEEYKEYLAEFGCASIYGHEFTGLCQIDRLDVVKVTKNSRMLDKDLPLNWYVIEEMNIDGIVICQDAEGNVYLKQPYKNANKIAESMLEYMECN